jgi:hypothetical protein
MPKFRHEYQTPEAAHAPPRTTKSRPSRTTIATTPAVHRLFIATDHAADQADLDRISLALKLNDIFEFGLDGRRPSSNATPDLEFAAARLEELVSLVRKLWDTDEPKRRGVRTLNGDPLDAYEDTLNKWLQCVTAFNYIYPLVGYAGTQGMVSVGKSGWSTDTSHVIARSWCLGSH